MLLAKPLPSSRAALAMLRKGAAVGLCVHASMGEGARIGVWRVARARVAVCAWPCLCPCPWHAGGLGGEQQA
jgi:hypothetical protein